MLFDETRAVDMENNAAGHGQGGGHMQEGLTLCFNDTNADGEISDVPAWDHPFGVNNEELDTDNPRANYRTVGLADMVVAIQEGRPHRCALELAVHATDVMTSILKSGETGSFVDTTTTCDRPEPFTPEAARALQA